jgi:hypothetical protein
MSDRSFSLKPFPNSNFPSSLKITGKIDRAENKLAIEYLLSGNLTDIIIPKSVDVPRRKNELWEKTCLEFFLGIKNSPQYWEFNLSPSGDWNIYYFDDYRQGMQEEIAFNSLPFIVESTSNSWRLSLKLDLNEIVSKESSLEMGIATVIKSTNENISYWALTHTDSQANFHRRNSFAIDI